jgi:hypothetical protein
MGILDDLPGGGQLQKDYKDYPSKPSAVFWKQLTRLYFGPRPPG